jgi:hypothetical protein
MLWEIFGVFGVCLVFYAAVTRFTTLAAITQMGSIQERAMPWASFSKPDAGGSGRTTTATTSGQLQPIKSPDDAAKKAETSGGKGLQDVRTKDKIVYTLSVINAILTAFLFGVVPQYFYWWHSPKAIMYIVHRWYTFRQQNQHYLLYDFCYWANGLALLYCWVCPWSDVMFQILFVCSNGPLAWAVLAFSQSLIFHSAPHMTSVFIHTSPMLLTFAIRWMLPEDHKANFTIASAEAPINGDPLNVSTFDLMWKSVAYFYGWWVVLYYVWVFVIMGPRIKRRGYKTLFDRVVSRGPTKFLAKISKNELIQKAAYMMTHFLFALFTMLLTTVYWRSFWIHVAFVLVIISVSAWNASGFYFTVFLAKYEEELRERAGLLSSPGVEGNMSPLQSPRGAKKDQ